jgi:uncharacterized small protein (DUF1192 family)
VLINAERLFAPEAGNGQANREAHMDLDDFRPKPKPQIVVGEKLDDLSVAELETRIVSLRVEIERVSTELATKRDRVTAAEALFKS